MILIILLLMHSFDTGNTNKKTSKCYGTTSNGHIIDSVQLPRKGVNFITYSSLGHYLGRTYVHSKVFEVILSSYKKLESITPNIKYMYGETGLIKGGLFKPHKTHQNGLSVDFMVPVKNARGQSKYLPTNFTNKFGYNIEFNNQGKFQNYTIDFEAMADHIKELDLAAKQAGISIGRVIFDPELQPQLLKTQNGEYIAKFIKLSSKRSWVRHDEHYHVDFNIPCE